MARKIETDDAPLLCTDTRVQSCVQASQSALSEPIVDDVRHLV